MSDFRLDFETGEYVLIAAERSLRPNAFKESSNKSCPFCIGNEELTPAASYIAYDGAEEDGKWLIRAFDNKYPAVTIGHSDNEEALRNDMRLDGYGIHEVVVDTPEHDKTLPDFSIEYVGKILYALQNRAGECGKKKDIRYVQIFKNHGRNAGASQEHSHWQIIAVPIIPPRLQQIYDGAMLHYTTNGECMYCQAIASELKNSSRIVEANDSFIAFAPFAPKFMYETHIYPRRHVSSFVEFSVADINGLAEVLRSVLQRFTALCGDTPYNICFLDRPTDTKYQKYFHWHMQIIPRTGNIAGFEFSTGCNINTLYPEEAAAQLRSVCLQST